MHLRAGSLTCVIPPGARQDLRSELAWRDLRGGTATQVLWRVTRTLAATGMTRTSVRPCLRLPKANRRPSLCPFQSRPNHLEWRRSTQAPSPWCQWGFRRLLHALALSWDLCLCQFRSRHGISKCVGVATAGCRQWFVRPQVVQCCRRLPGHRKAGAAWMFSCLAGSLRCHCPHPQPRTM